MKKLLFFDCETTGLDSQKHEICQFAAKVLYYENEKFIVPLNTPSTISVNIIPVFPELADPQAMAIHKLSISDLQATGVSSFTFYNLLTDFFDLHINKFDPTDKFYPAGFNVEFDYQFLASFFKRKLDNYFGSWTNHRIFDALHTARMLAFCDIPPFNELSSFKLSHCINMLPLEQRPILVAHDAMSDIEATIELFKYEVGILNLLKTGW